MAGINPSRGTILTGLQSDAFLRIFHGIDHWTHEFRQRWFANTRAAAADSSLESMDLLTRSFYTGDVSNISSVGYHDL